MDLLQQVKKECEHNLNLITIKYHVRSLWVVRGGVLQKEASLSGVAVSCLSRPD